jgi:alcohol dehydrogenase
MKAWRLERAGGRLALEERLIPEPRQGGVTVRMRAAPVLTYMAQVVAGKLATYQFPDGPFTPGTGGFGEVASVGGGVHALAPGDRVVVDPHYVADRAVPEPARILIGLTRISPDSAALQAEWPDGTFAEYAHLPAAVLTRVPASVDLPAVRLAIFGKFAVPYGGLQAIALTAGETLIVNGASGNFGSAAVLLGVALGCARVIAAGRDAGALAGVVRKAGSRACAVALSGDAARDVAALRDAAGGAVDAAIDLVGRAADANATLATLRALRRGGRLALMGSMTVPLPLPYGEMLINDWTVQGRFMYPRNAIGMLLRLAAAGTLALDAVETASYPLAELEAAMAGAAKQRGLQATVLTVGSELGPVSS